MIREDGGLEVHEGYDLCLYLYSNRISFPDQLHSNTSLSILTFLFPAVIFIFMHKPSSRCYHTVKSRTSCFADTISSTLCRWNIQDGIVWEPQSLIGDLATEEWGLYKGMPSPRRSRLPRLHDPGAYKAVSSKGPSEKGVAFGVWTRTVYEKAVLLHISCHILLWTRSGYLVQ